MDAVVYVDVDVIVDEVDVFGDFVVVYDERTWPTQKFA